MNGRFVFGGRGGGGGAVFLELFEGLEGAVIGAFGGGFVAAEELEGVVAGGLLEGEGEAAVLVDVLPIAAEFVLNAADFDVE